MYLVMAILFRLAFRVAYQVLFEPGKIGRGKIGA